MAAHILGNIDSGVKPGIVLISLTTSDPSGNTKKSTRARPSQPTASKARAARSRSDVATSSGGRGDVELGVLLGEVLGREVVELVVAGDPDLRGHACLGGAVQRLEHAALDLASALGRDLDQRLGSWRWASSTASASSPAWWTLEMPIEEPPRAGLTKTG